MKKLLIPAAVVTLGVACSDGDKRKFGLIETKKETRTVEVEVPSDGTKPGIKPDGNPGSSTGTDNAAAEACLSDLGKSRALAEKIAAELEAKNGELASLGSAFDQYKGQFNADQLEAAKAAARRGVVDRITAELLRLTPTLPSSEARDEILKAAGDDIRQAFLSNPKLVFDLADEARAAFHKSQLKADALAFYAEHKDVAALVAGLNDADVKAAVSKEMKSLFRGLQDKVKSGAKGDELAATARSEFDAAFDRLLQDERFGGLMSELRAKAGDLESLRGPAEALTAELVKIGQDSQAFATVETSANGLAASLAGAIWSSSITTWLSER